jgi:hypothetical protein
LNPKNCYQNILETATVTLSAGTENAAYPLYRLSDRDIGKTFRTTAAVTTTVKVDQGASNIQAIDRLLVPVGHNLSGMALSISWSDNDGAYTNAVTPWTQPDAALINKEWTSISHRWWKFTITSPGSIPQIAELFLTATYTWERPASRPTGAFDPVFNVERLQTSGGGVRYLKHGDPKRQRQYSCNARSDAQRTNLLALNDAWAACNPFWLCDHEGVWIYGELSAPIDMSEAAYLKYPFQFKFLELLPL